MSLGRALSIVAALLSLYLLWGYRAETLISGFEPDPGNPAVMVAFGIHDIYLGALPWLVRSSVDNGPTSTSVLRPELAVTILLTVLVTIHWRNPPTVVAVLLGLSASIILRAAT